jgi:toxin ParE1/3/4
VAREIAWAESAVDALLEACEFIAKGSPSYASALAVRAESAAESLGTFPERGRQVPEYQDSDVRELFIDSYRLIYRLRESSVVVIAFVHGARDLAALIAGSEV